MSNAPLGERPTPVFDETFRLLESKGSGIVDMSRDQSFIETQRALYAIVEETSWNVGRVYAQFSRTIFSNKNFAIHGPRLQDDSINEIGKMGFEMLARSAGNAKVRLATTEMQVRRNVDEFESAESTSAKVKK